MLNQIALRNIRLFNTLSTFNLPKLTVFCGINGSGKSTVLKSLLLIRQSQGVNEIYGKREGMLRFVGSQVDLGDYSTFVSRNNLSKDINISLTVESPLLRQIIPDLPRNRRDIYLRKKRPKFLLKVDLFFKPSIRSSKTDEAGIITAFRPQGILKKARFSVLAGDREFATWAVRFVSFRKRRGPHYRIYIPKNEISSSETELAKLLRQLGPKLDLLSFDTSLDGLLPSYIETKDDSYMLPTQIRRGLSDFSSALKRIHYLAPLRTASKRFYLTEYDVAPDLDPSGEFLPYILGGIIDEPNIDHVPPGRKFPLRQGLLDALNGWLSYLNTGIGFNSNSKKDELQAKALQGRVVEINLKGTTGKKKYSISDSGFGYSQVLPILVKGLLTPRGHTLIVEQPELHLNPALQVRLADFFISMIRAGKQVIIETHSEHIVNAIRVRTANDLEGFLSSNSVIYFLDTEKGQSVTHELSIKPDGTVPKWPYNFFGEALELSGQLLRAQANFIKDQRKS